MATLSTANGPLELAAVASDLDRTLTDPELKPFPGALAELVRLRQEGIRTILCTGRAQAELPPAVVQGVFDGLVLEGGAVAGLPGRLEPMQAPEGWAQAVEAQLRAHGVAFIQGETYFSILAEHVEDAQRLAEKVPVTFHLNRDRVDITPPGVDKGAGLRHVLGLLGVTGPVLAFGDNHNDIPLLQASTHGVAVGNAVDELKQVAHEVTASYGGFGVADFLRERVPGQPATPGSTRRPPVA